MRIIKSLLIFLCVFWTTQSYGQIIPQTEEEVRMEMEKRGIDEDELRERLAQNGIDIDNLDNLTAEQFLKMEEIIAEMEKEVIPLDTIKVEESKKEIKSGESKPKEIDKPVQKTEVIPPPAASIPQSALPPAEIYGQQLFRNNNFVLKTQTEDLKAPGDYILGPGDEVRVSIWGASQLDSEYSINKDGYIRVLNGNVRIFLKGLSLDNAKEKLRSKFSQYYNFNSGEFDVNLNYSRAVTINIMGEVFNPGTVTLSAANSAFNALVAANGPNNLGSVRNILLVLNEGGNRTVDVYKYISDPASATNLYVSEGDLIYVPIAEKIVNLQGAVKRPFKYELKDNEGIRELVSYSGGFKENAYRSTIQVTRYEDDIQRIIDVDYLELIRQNRNFQLKDGDAIIVKEISTSVENYVDVLGAVENQGKFERSDNMRILDIINKAGLQTNAFTDIIYVVRTNPNGSKTFEKVNLTQIINDPSSIQNFELNNRDVITVWSKDRFADDLTITVGGSVREPANYSYDVGENVRVSDAIALSGGLRRDAYDIGLIHRQDPLNLNKIVYFRVNIANALANNASSDNIVLQPFDRLEVLSKDNFSEKATVIIDGAVNNPGTFQHGVDMSIKDLLTLAGGFKLGAFTERIEVSRIIIKDNLPTQTVIANLTVDKDLNTLNSGTSEFVLEPYDIVNVRFVPEFKFQQNVNVTGEVSFPGNYSLLGDNEKILDLINRAGGISKEAFPAGATLYRQADEIGYIIMRLDEVLKDKKSKYNFILKNGDILDIPKQVDFVTITGATRVNEVYKSEVIDQNNTVKVAYHKGKNAKFYIDTYAGGMNEQANKNLIFVQHPNGEIEKSKGFLFFKSYPSVRKGSIIRVGYKPPKEINEKEKTEVDWTKVLSDSVAQAMSVLTLILLIQRLD
jgi:protein involved in polysaccharide export with SLBB domain